MPAPSIETTLAFALGKHWGQTDKAGAPYILHPIRVMFRMTTDAERRVALLHDVVEDCGVTPGQLIALGFPRQEVEAILALTKSPAEEDDYQAFIRRVAGNPLASRVKLGDLEDNMDVSRLKRVDAAAKKRLAKYAEAKAFLELAVHGGAARTGDSEMEREGIREAEPSRSGTRGDTATLASIEARLHDVIRQRCVEGRLRVPKRLPRLSWTLKPKVWFPVPGMAGGFTYRWSPKVREPMLIVESWSRVVDGSGMRHAVTARSTRIVAEGFV